MTFGSVKRPALLVNLKLGDFAHSVIDEEDKYEQARHQEESRVRASRGPAAQVLYLALPRVAAYAVGKVTTREVPHVLLAGERARVLAVNDLVGLDRQLQVDDLAVPSVYHQEQHVRVVHRLERVLQVVATDYSLVRVVVLGANRRVAQHVKLELEQRVFFISLV